MSYGRDQPKQRKLQLSVYCIPLLNKFGYFVSLRECKHVQRSLVHCHGEGSVVSESLGMSLRQTSRGEDEQSKQAHFMRSKNKVSLHRKILLQLSQSVSLYIDPSIMFVLLLI